MARFLIDTNHMGAAIVRVSELRDRIQRTYKRGDRFATCWPVLCELEAGIVNTKEPQRNHKRLADLMNFVAVWPQDWDVVWAYGEIAKSLRERGRILSPADITLVAFAKLGNVTVLTTDLDFEATPEIRAENWLA